MLIRSGALVAAALIGVLTVAGARGSAAHAAEPEDLAASMAAPWPALERSDGSLINAMDGPTAFGEAMMGYGMLLEGVRSDSRTLQRSGIHALTYAATRGGRTAESVFENLAVASAYNFARDRLVGDETDSDDGAAVRGFQEERSTWEGFLKRIPPIGDLYRTEPSERFTNKYIVEAIEILELDRTGLTSRVPGAILGGQHNKAMERARWLLLERIPGMLQVQQIPVDGLSTALLSDMPDAPLAYHALSTAMYARATELAGLRDNATVRRTLARAVNASWVFAAPDGDIAYWGRSHQQGWALTATAYAADVASRTVFGPPAERYRSLVARALGRVSREHRVTDEGMHIVPAMRDGVKAAEPGVDGNAGMPSSGGLALVFVEWLLAEPAVPAAAPTSLRSDDESSAIVGREEAQFAVVRRGPVWFAVRRSDSEDHPGDFRYDFGLVALKYRRGDRWIDVLRQRPKLIKEGDGVGPRLIAGKSRYLPFGRTMRISRYGTVTVEGGYRTTGGRVVRRGVRFRYVPITSCGGVAVTWAVRPGDSYGFSVFDASRPVPTMTTPVTLTGKWATTSFSVSVKRSRSRPFSSALDALLTRTTAVLKAPTKAPLVVAMCPRA